MEAKKLEKAQNYHNCNNSDYRGNNNSNLSWISGDYVDGTTLKDDRINGNKTIGDEINKTA